MLPLTTSLAPAPENYAPAPRFEKSATVRETDFAQLIASGMGHARALVEVGILRPSVEPLVTQEDIEDKARALFLTKRVRERVDYYHQLHRMGMTITSERILQESACIAYSDFAQIFDVDGVPLTNPHEIPRHTRAAIKEWGFDKNGCLKVKFHDKIKGLEMVGDIAGVFNDAHAAKAPQVTVTLEAAPTPATITITAEGTDQHACLG